MSGSSIQSRLADLEHAAGADICEHCGVGPDGFPAKPWTFAPIDLNRAADAQARTATVFRVRSEAAPIRPD